jgi:hypothetical protein
VIGITDGFFLKTDFILGGEGDAFKSQPLVRHFSKGFLGHLPDNRFWRSDKKF